MQDTRQVEDISFWALIREDWIANGRDWFSLGFRALAVHRLGEYTQAVKNRFLQLVLWRIYWFWQRHCRNRGIEIPPSVKIGRQVKIHHQGGIVFHPAVVVSKGCRIRHGVTLGASSTRRSRKAPVLEEDVDIGVGAALLGDIVVGRASRIGANVVLTETVPPGSVVVLDRPKILLKKISGPEDQALGTT